jgi:hypothetical protein
MRDGDGGMSIMGAGDIAMSATERTGAGAGAGDNENLGSGASERRPTAIIMASSSDMAIPTTTGSSC